MSTDRGNEILKDIAGFNFDEQTGICEVRRKGEPPCRKPLYECMDIILALQAANAKAVSDYNKSLRRHRSSCRAPVW